MKLCSEGEISFQLLAVMALLTAQRLGYSALTTSRKALNVEARLSRFHTIAKLVV
jgi:hypothetical protein